MHCWRALEQETASADIAARTMEVLHGIDVMDLASELTVPTLVLHARDDARIPFEQGRELAATIAGAQFVPLDSRNHVLLDTEPAWDTLTSALRAFLDRARPEQVALPGCNLTAAETDVLRLVSKGLSNSDIAETLGKSEKTVRNQVSVLFDKVGVKTRAELIVRALSGTTGQMP